MVLMPRGLPFSSTSVELHMKILQSLILYRLLCIILVHRKKFQKKKHLTHVKLTAAVLLR